MITAYTDGACRVSNPGVCSCAWVIYGEHGGPVSKGYYLGYNYSNNFAEYHGLLYLLEHLYAHNLKNVQIYSDSAVVVNQVNQKWNASNHPDLEKFMRKAYGLITAGNHRLYHIRGHGKNQSAERNAGNDEADRICNAVLDARKEDYEKQN